LQPRRQLIANGQRVALGRRALDIASVLAEAKGEIVTKEELLDAVWPGLTVEENALQVHIVALRKALGPDSERLKTVRGVGYQLDVDSAAGSRAMGLPESAPEEAHPSVAPPSAPPTTIWKDLRRFRPALVVAALLAALLGAWWIVGPDLGLRAHGRIPVVVRALTAGGSGDPTETALANGITDELIDRLRRIPELRIATVEANGSVQDASFRNAYVVDGSIRRSGDQLRVMTRLADADGEILWSQTFNRRLVDLLDMQERIAASIADALSVSFDVGTDSTAYGGTDNPEAYAAFLEARAEWNNLDQNVPMHLLDRALTLDPDYIRALAYKSIGYDMQVNLRSNLTRQQALALLAQADESSRRAVALKPDLWIGHHARAWYHFTRRDLPSAVRSHQRMDELDRGNEPGLRSEQASYESFIGRPSKALALIESAELIDPVRRYDGGRITRLQNLGKYREALEFAQQIAGDDDDALRAFAIPIFWSHLALGEEAEAIRFSEQHSPGLAEGLRAFRANGALLTMSSDELRQWADRHYGEGGQILVANNALYAGYTGHPQLAVELMRVAFERPGAFAIAHLWYPAMAEARKTDAFEKLVTDIGLVQVWRESGDWGDYCRPVSASEISCH
jgi:DNA-binding winged helix-turn-helix (wHTH) protein/TolB-like protein